MALTTLDPNTALIIVDLQKGIVGMPGLPAIRDIVVTKRSWGAFANTDLEVRLKARGVTQVVIAGVATGTGVEATARQAYEQGFNVTLTTDAMTDMRPEAHDYSIGKVFPRLGESGATREIIDLLPKRNA